MEAHLCLAENKGDQETKSHLWQAIPLQHSGTALPLWNSMFKIEQQSDKHYDTM